MNKVENNIEKGKSSPFIKMFSNFVCLETNSVWGKCLIKLTYERSSLLVKCKKTNIMSKSQTMQISGETAHYEMSHMNLHCLQTPVIVFCSEMVKYNDRYSFWKVIETK